MKLFDKIKKFFNKELTSQQIAQTMTSSEEFYNEKGELCRVYRIPVGGLSKKLAEEQICKLIANYKDDIKIDDNIDINQINNGYIPYYKEYWFPQRNIKD